LGRRTDENGFGSWPTIRAGKTTAENLETWQKRKDAGGAASPPIGMIVKASLPTPTKRDDKGQTQNPDRMDYVPNIVKASWPTVKASTGGPEPDGETGMNLPTHLRGTLSSGCLARTEKFVVRLMTLSSWLMGYTAHYLRHWETASSRKSPQK